MSKIGGHDPHRNQNRLVVLQSSIPTHGCVQWIFQLTIVVHLVHTENL